MYLKSIEIHGFKSFANKTVFEFHNGITAIVGPNGSGKSNVADAVRWVLGEQRVKQLRGSNMQDVIFSGTENRKPQSYAMVSLTLDNSDHMIPVAYDELTIARRLFRSGESEYLLNGTPCRLKEVNELFYDTGIGKEGYSIIGQGQIDKILNGKPEDRRELFDEAAGIVKFKHRKEMTQKKLEDEQANLVRISDILAEIDRQMGPLSTQAEKAKVYLSKKEELRAYDINMFLLETDRIHVQIRETDERAAIVNDELDETRRTFENTKTEYEKIEDEMEELEAASEHAKDQLNKTNILKQQLEGQINVLKEQINNARTTDAYIDDRSNTAANDLKSKTEELETLKKQNEELEQKLSAITLREEEASKALQDVRAKTSSAAAGIEKQKQDVIQLLNERASTKANLQRFETLKEESQARKGEISQKLLLLKSDEEEQTRALDFCKEELAKLQDEIKSIRDVISGKEQEIASIQNRLSSENEKLNLIQTSYHRENSRLESLINITERYDGYGNSIRKVMARKDEVSGLIGVVADIFRTDKEYELAVETALGASIQNIVVDSEDTAKDMIRFLKDNKFGRATFLPLTSVQPSSFREPKALSETGVIGTANTLVHYEDRFKRLADYLLGRILVVDNLDHAIMIAGKYRYSLRIVTIDGESLNPGGSMTGGAFRNTSNLLSRRREIEEEEQNVKKLEKEMNRLTASVEQMKSLRTKNYNDIDVQNESLHKKLLEQNTVKMNMESASSRCGEIQSSIAAIRKESDEMESRIRELSRQRADIDTELASSDERETEANSRIEELTSLLEASRSEEEKAVRDAEDIHLESAGLRQKHDFLLENINRITEEAARSREELNSLKASKGDAAEEISRKESEIEDLQKTIDDSSSIYDELNKMIADSGTRKDELTKKHKSFLSKREDLSAHISELDKEQFRLGSRKEACDDALEKQVSYMWEEYELTYDRAKELRDDRLSNVSSLRKKTTELRNEIRALGNVNVNAIEDYRAMKERFEFLNGQHDDIIEAQKALNKIIEELDAGMRAQFTEKFAAITKEFDKVFSILFGGGKGTLALTESDDVLEAGIRIIAQPPGKKLQNMMQLSGGEKSLTAIALLFAIQNLKPSPFCLLDEIEAALDDANVKRFAEYLKILTKSTQFIIITHRRGTMTSADRLYGVTMQEKGVSALVSVDLLGDMSDSAENTQQGENNGN